MDMPETLFTRFVDGLNTDYERLHTAKEDAFWAAYMGLLPDAESARADLVAKDNAWKRFLADPSRLEQVREIIQRGQDAWNDDDDDVEIPTAEEATALDGWLATFEAHVIESKAAQKLHEEITHDEGALATARGGMKLGYTAADGTVVPASSVRLGVMVSNDKDEGVRRAAWEAMRSIETFVLEHGFLEIVKKRNRLGRMLGGEDFYDANVRRVEGMTKHEVFELLDDLERRTRDRAQESLAELKAKHGPSVLEPWNLRYLAVGDISNELEPYFPFDQALDRWGRTFMGLGVDYRGAELVLDLVDRKGKYENGFMHGPVPAWKSRGTFRPARIQFTANAIPGLMGAGKRAIETLFHEGGHAAHFANNEMPAPCFGQEFAPSSVAFAETQSMFFDSLIQDAAWQTRYAKNKAGEAVPLELVERAVAKSQPMKAWGVRAMLAVCYGERAIYEIPDDELTPQRVLDELRAVEKRLLFLDRGSPRPILAVPHLLSAESSAYYHGYVLADMAVHQTREHFLKRDGHIVDNPRVAPELREVYWREGNSRRFRDFVERLTGKPLQPGSLAATLNQTVDEAVERQLAMALRMQRVAESRAKVDLNARIRVMHGNEEIATNADGSFKEMCTAFAKWVKKLEKDAATKA